MSALNVMRHARLRPTPATLATSALLLLCCALSAGAAAEAPVPAAASPAPAERELALPGVAPAIVLPSVAAMRAAARAERSRTAAAAQASVPALAPPTPAVAPRPSRAAADTAVARTPPPPDADGVDALERLRARLAERLSAVKPPDATSPYELQVSTRAVAGAAARTSPARAATAQAAANKPLPLRAPKPALGADDWAYEGEHGPAQWGGLCASGQRQSPIDIRGGLPVALEAIGLHYQAGAFSVLDTGHTVQVNVAPGSHVQLGGRRFELQQFHVHRPSEETLDGRRFDLSVHLVHRSAQGARLVVAVLVQQGSDQPVLRSVLGNLPLEKHRENPASSLLNPADLLPGEQGYYTYMGSLTTPPCSEDVQWVVLRHPVAASSEQIDLFGRLYMNNIRPLQQAAGRRILQTR